ncbi:MAG: LON peptidase substrate-binding domain-containing protein, partial [Candidatus Delongbacteria bacterium]|nr:LON peptidase substrate-binding domain-containing protein [Candidatus Delongbacteria bacterium]
MAKTSNIRGRKIFTITEELPIIPLMNMVVFPNVIMPLVVNDANLIKLINDSLSSNKIVGIFANQPDDDGGYRNKE